jgi:hypothetical protein
MVIMVIDLPSFRQIKPHSLAWVLSTPWAFRKGGLWA